MEGIEAIRDQLALIVQAVVLWILVAVMIRRTRAWNGLGRAMVAFFAVQATLWSHIFYLQETESRMGSLGEWYHALALIVVGPLLAWKLITVPVTRVDDLEEICRELCPDCEIPSNRTQTGS